MRAVPRLCDVYTGICFKNEGKAWKTLSQGSRRMPVGTMKTEHTEHTQHTYNLTQRLLRTV